MSAQPTRSELPPDHRFIASNQICVGAKLRMPIYDDRDILLLAAGQHVTEEFLELLVTRGIESLKVHAEDLPYVLAGQPQGAADTIPLPHPTRQLRDANAGTRRLDALLDEPGGLTLPPQGEPFSNAVQQPPRESYSAELRHEMVERQVQSVRRVDSVFENLLGGQGADIETLTSIADAALDDLATDCDLFASLGLNPLATEYPSRHGLHCCFLALSIGTNLQLDQVTLRELALGCLIHDAGMLMIDQSVWRRMSQLDGIDFIEVTKHPIRVFDALLLDRENISNRTAFIAYQMHERNDGSGYPRRRQSNQIHFLSKVAAVADIYAAISAGRPHRPGLLPHRAIEQVVQMGNDGVLDASAVRALLTTTSMYPIGSYVLLSDGRVAQTIRSNQSDFDSPVVEAWSPGKLNQPGEVINLAEVRDVSIVRPIASLDCDVSALSTVDGNAAKTRIDRMVKLIDLADTCQSPEVLEMRRSPRLSMRRPVRVYFKSAGDSEKEWQSELFESRNISRGGIALVGQLGRLPDEVVVRLDDNVAEPVFLLARVVRREAVQDDVCDYGLVFLQKVAAPRSGKPRRTES